MTPLRVGDVYEDDAEIAEHLAPRLADGAQVLQAAGILEVRRKLDRIIAAHRGARMILPLASPTSTDQGSCPLPDRPQRVLCHRLSMTGLAGRKTQAKDLATATMHGDVAEKFEHGCIGGPLKECPVLLFAAGAARRNLQTPISCVKRLSRYKLSTA